MTRLTRTRGVNGKRLKIDNKQLSDVIFRVWVMDLWVVLVLIRWYREIQTKQIIKLFSIFYCFTLIRL